MSKSNGYFIIPRSVTSDPRYKTARLKYQKVLFVLFEHVAFAPTTHAIGHKIINIRVGQLCITSRHLVKLCNEDVKFEEDLVDKNIIDRAIAFFEKCGFVSQEVIHRKSIITITVPAFYDRFKNTSEPRSEPKVSQKRANKEEEKEDKDKKNHPHTPSFFDSAKSDDSTIDDLSSILKKEEIAELVEKHGSREKVLETLRSFRESGQKVRTSLKSTLLAWKIYAIPSANLQENKKLGIYLENLYDNPLNSWGLRNYKDLKNSEGTLFEVLKGQSSQTHFVPYSETNYKEIVLNYIKEKKIMKKEGVKNEVC